jgi:tetratricopeptide (TPR) repeat protein
MVWSRRCALLAASLGVSTPLGAQHPPSLDDLSGQRRPRLAAQADTNDWEAYFDYAVSWLRTHPDRARLGFFWAQRLDPSRAEPLYGRWVAYWMGVPKWWEEYAREAKSVVNSPQVVQVDSLYTQALLRNPFVAQTLTMLLYDRLPGQWGDDILTQAFLEYSAAKLSDAADDFAYVIRSNPRRYHWLRYYRALAFTGLEQWDSAAVELNQLLEELRLRDTTSITYTYQSRELLLYGLGLLKLAQGDRAGGKSAIENALVENLSFFPAHAALGQQAMEDRDTARALWEFAQALELSHGDPWMRYRYGQALAQVRRPREAAAQMDTVIRAEPYFAEPYFVLGAAREATGEPDSAAAAYAVFVRLAPRRATQEISYARGRLVALAARKP